MCIYIYIFIYPIKPTDRIKCRLLGPRKQLGAHIRGPCLGSRGLGFRVRSMPLGSKVYRVRLVVMVLALALLLAPPRSRRRPEP